MKRGRVQAEETFQLFHNIKGAALSELKRLEGALKNLQFEGRASRGENAKELDSILRFFKEELSAYIEAEEKIFFPFLESHLPKLGSILQVLSAEHAEIQRNLNDLARLARMVPNAKSEAKRSRQMSEIWEKGTYVIYLLRLHLRVEEKSVYEVAARELRMGEKAKLLAVLKEKEECSSTQGGFFDVERQDQRPVLVGGH